jgi:hypothetical protein
MYLLPFLKKEKESSIVTVLYYIVFYCMYRLEIIYLPVTYWSTFGIKIKILV